MKKRDIKIGMILEFGEGDFSLIRQISEDGITEYSSRPYLDGNEDENFIDWENYAFKFVEPIDYMPKELLEYLPPHIIIWWKKHRI